MAYNTPVPSLDEILHFLRDLAPEESALPGDPVGLLIGPAAVRPVTTIGVCVDASVGAVATAIHAGSELVVAHHPLIYHPLKRINPAIDPIGRAVGLLVRSETALYAMHTNWDRAAGGINDTLARALSLGEFRPLAAEGERSLPRIGRLPAPMTLAALSHLIEERLDCRGSSSLRHTAFDNRTIETVAVCGGAGAFLAAEVQRAGAGAYITSDVRHHEFIDAAGRGLALFDAGHYATEAPGMRALADHLAREYPAVRVIRCDEGNSL